ncbi:dihydrodipicolinate synthase family protein [Paenarthrobacter nitroguajacolicus]
MTSRALSQDSRPISAVCPILVVPFHEDGAVDYEGFTQVIEHVVGAGCRAATLFGLASEYYKLTDQERERLVDIFLEVSRRYPDFLPIVSITAHSSDVATREAQRLTGLGVGAICVMPPFFLSPDLAAVLDHLSLVCSAAGSTPVMVQYAPTFTGARIAPQDVATLAAKHPNFQYMKIEVQPPSSYIAEVLRSTNGQVQPLIGFNGLFAPEAFAHGLIGIQGGPAAVDMFQVFWSELLSGDVSASERTYQRFLPYISYWMQNLDVAVAVEKEILARRGVINSAYCRTPHARLNEFDMSMITRFMDEFGLKSADKPTQ